MIMIILADKLNQILKSFHTLAGVRIAVFDEWCNEIAAYPTAICSFCKTLRRDAEFDRRCQCSDREAFAKAKALQAQYTYRCHAGLFESICPIVLDGQTAGYLMIGQFLRKSDLRKNDPNFWKEHMENGVSQREIDELHTLGDETASAIASILTVCAEYLCFSKTVATRKTKLAQQAESYIRSHLHEPLPVDHLAEVLRISRTSVYQLFKNSFGKSVTEYINHLKIETAKEMLARGESTQAILEAVNISGANYFCRLFRQETGVSLREYKRSLPQKLSAQIENQRTSCYNAGRNHCERR